MAKTGSAVSKRPTLFGGSKGAATPRRNSVADTNTRQMTMATWTPRHMRRAG